MCNAELIRQKRVAHHEAAHAVMVVANGFTLGETFLTASTTDDGTLGGWTGWPNPVDPESNPTPDVLKEHSWKVVLVLYAGRCAEEHLATVDATVEVPREERNWDNDENEARWLLDREPLKSLPDIKEELRGTARAEIVKHWATIATVAAGLLKPLPAKREIIVSKRRDGKELLPASPVIRHGDVYQLLHPSAARWAASPK